MKQERNENHMQSWRGVDERSSLERERRERSVLVCFVSLLRLNGEESRNPSVNFGSCIIRVEKKIGKDRWIRLRIVIKSHEDNFVLFFGNSSFFY